MILEADCDYLFEEFLQQRATQIFDLVEHYAIKPASSFGTFFPKTPPIPDTGIQVFTEYKGTRLDAVFFPSQQMIEFDGELYTPWSAAHEAVRAAGGTGRPSSGWNFWKYADDLNQERPIDNLRE